MRDSRLFPLGHAAPSSVVALIALALGCGRIGYDPIGGEVIPGEELTACVDAIAIPGDVISGQTTVYVDATIGVNTPNGCVNAATPCRSIQYAIDNYVAGRDGDVVLARGGMVYAERLVLDAARSGSPGSPTVITAWPGTGRPVVDGGGTSEHTVSLCCGGNAASHVVIAGLAITGGVSVGVDINGSGADHNAVVRNQVHANGEGPSTFPTDAGITIINGADDNLIAHNEVFDNRDSSATAPNGIFVVDGRGNHVIGNVVRNNEGSGIRYSGTSGVVSANRVLGNGDYGIDVVTGDLNVFCHNRIFDNNAGGLRLNNATSSHVLHQTVADNRGPGISLWNDSPDNVIKNTITAFNTGCGLEEHSSGRPGEPVDSYNLLFENVGGAWCAVQRDQPGSDLDSLDPRFVDRLARDYGLSASSPAIGSGEGNTTIGSLR